MSVTCEVSRLETSREVSEEQLENMPLMFVTCEVLKSEISSAFKALHPPNSNLMFSTFDVSNREEKVRDFSEGQFPNITIMVVTFDVLKDDRSRDSSDIQLLNIASMLVTLHVSKLVTLSDLSEKHSRNM